MAVDLRWKGKSRPRRLYDLNAGTPRTSTRSLHRQTRNPQHHLRRVSANGRQHGSERDPRSLRQAAEATHSDGSSANTSAYFRRGTANLHLRPFDWSSTLSGPAIATVVLRARPRVVRGRKFEGWQHGQSADVKGGTSPVRRSIRCSPSVRRSVLALEADGCGTSK